MAGVTSEQTKSQGHGMRAALAILALLAGVTAYAISERRATPAEPSDARPAAVESRSLRFVDKSDGSVDIVDADTGKLVHVLPSGVDGAGFIRSFMRGLARERRKVDQGGESPFTLMRTTDGHLTLEDPTTGRRIALAAFGSTNAQSFAALLKGKE